MAATLVDMTPTRYSLRVPWARGAMPWLLLTCALIGITLLVQRGSDPSDPLSLHRPWAPEAELSQWHDEWVRRASQHVDVPDPPGPGEMTRATYWLSRASYRLDVRRRGSRFVVEIHGVDEQVSGGGWAAFGEGVITPPSKRDAFAQTTATFLWSCLGVRYRYASDGVGRLVFSRDGSRVEALYMAFEAPTIWLGGVGVRALPGEDSPPRDTLVGPTDARDHAPPPRNGHHPSAARSRCE